MAKVHIPVSANRQIPFLTQVSFDAAIGGEYIKTENAPHAGGESLLKYAHVCFRPK